MKCFSELVTINDVSTVRSAAKEVLRFLYFVATYFTNFETYIDYVIVRLELFYLEIERLFCSFQLRQRAPYIYYIGFSKNVDQGVICIGLAGGEQQARCSLAVPTDNAAIYALVDMMALWLMVRWIISVVVINQLLSIHDLYI